MDGVLVLSFVVAALATLASFAARFGTDSRAGFADSRV
jgi:hypothetical protein